MDKPVVILVAGFLGAGKTTLLGQATERFVGRGHRVGLVTNDQAANLVDTLTLRAGDSPVREVTGGCFCCRFDDLLDSIDGLINEGRLDIVIGEPVGSCTDLSATVVQPIKALHSGRYQLAPLTVLVDPDRVCFLVEPRPLSSDRATFPENVLYIYLKQLEEADVIALNKLDLLSEKRRLELEDALRQRFPRAHVLSISAKEGIGIDAWMDHMLGGGVAGQTITDVDYDVYADGEAALGWLNASHRLESDSPADWESFGRALMTALRDECLRRSAEVAHLKILLNSGSGSFVGNLTSASGNAMWHGRIERPSPHCDLTINARVHITPEVLRAVVDRCMEATIGTKIRIGLNELQCFAPSRPQPTHRYANVV